MNSDFFDALDMLEKERGISKTYMIDKIEAALIAAIKKEYGTSENVIVELSDKEKDVKIQVIKTVVETVENPQAELSLEDAQKTNDEAAVGDEVFIDAELKNFGRISAQTAKQVIIQGIREAERGLIYQEFSSHEHEIVSAQVHKIDARTKSAILEIGKAQTQLIAGEQVPGETFREGDIIKVYVVEVRNTSKGPQIMVSRTHPGLVKRLFELEVPEIFDGTVEIKNISREAGSRTKIAVYSKDDDVDPIGACVGQRGVRVGKIVNELRGEKIDIIKYSEDPREFIAAALSPAKAIEVTLTEDEKSCRVIVPDDQLSLAIGKEGQNARLAAKLTGWKIDIKTQSLADSSFESEDGDLPEQEEE